MTESSFPDLLYPANFKLDKGPPKEKAGEQDIRIKRNFICIHELLERDHSASSQLLMAFNKLHSDLTPSSIETHAALPNVVPPPPTFGDLLSRIMDSPSHGASTPHKHPPPEHDIALRGSKRPHIDSLNTFMRSWKIHQPNIPEIFDVSMTRSLVY
ncbi:hypothetical protein EV359DRAFT_86964 [Lentinula novae-zelandiae]|nr:hypothetical protein EV359DRAFT_86964 [Lentinula novae-zelandiae]